MLSVYEVEVIRKVDQKYVQVCYSKTVLSFNEAHAEEIIAGFTSTEGYEVRVNQLSEQKAKHFIDQVNRTIVYP